MEDNVATREHVSAPAEAPDSAAPDLVRPDTRGPREPGPWSLWEAARQSLLIVIGMVILGAGLGVAAGLVRKPKYTATATMSVLHLNFGVPGALSGFSTASAALADTYARAVHADGVTRPLAAQFHTSANTIRGDLGAVAVPNSPVFTVTARANGSFMAVALANAAAIQLSKYIQSVNASSPDAARLYKLLSHAVTNATVAQQNVAGQRAAIALLVSQPHGARRVTARDRASLARAQATANLDVAVEQSLKNAYQQSVVGQSATQFLQPMQAAVRSTSDRRARMELFVFAGIALGLAAGLGIAAIRYNHRRRVAFG